MCLCVKRGINEETKPQEDYERGIFLFLSLKRFSCTRNSLGRRICGKWVSVLMTRTKTWLGLAVMMMMVNASLAGLLSCLASFADQLFACFSRVSFYK